MQLTVNQLKCICPTQSLARLAIFVGPLNKYLVEFQINTPLRVAHFLAQAAHETAGFQYMKELASGKEYENRRDLGNVFKGDGIKFKGRGIFQTTGRANYKAVSQFLFKDDTLLTKPELLEQPDNAVHSACYYWQTHKLNDFADADDIFSITRKINGGLNGIDSRKDYYKRAKSIIQ